MFESIILLTEAAEQVALSRILRKHRQDLTVRSAADIDGVRRIEAAFLRQARLVAFASDAIVPSDILASLGYGAYNFHPGSPDYPGWAPAHFALYDRAGEFGATFHVMTERVDSGAILDVALFPVPQDSSVLGLGELTYAHLLKLFSRWAAELSNRPSELAPRRAMPWSGRTTSRRTYRSICDIPLDITRDELWRRMRAFGGNHHGISPTINLHGVTFTATFQAEGG